MATIVSTAITYARSVFGFLFFIIVAGIVTYNNVPREAEPDINIPNIYISMHYEGISPEDSERLLIRPMEQAMRSIDGVEEMRATAYENGGNIILEFDAGFDVDQALSDVRAQVDIAKSELPSDADEPRVREINLSLFPILVVTLSGAVPERTLTTIATDLQQRLRSLPRVLKVEIAGDRERQLELIIDPAKIRHYGLTAQQVLSAVGRNNALVASGQLDSGHGAFAIKVPGLVNTAKDLLNFPIRLTSGETITLRDIADIRSTFKDRQGFARINGQTAVALEISKRTGENIIKTVEDVRAIVEQQRQYFPPSIEITYTQNKSKRVIDMVSDLENSVMLAILIVVAVIIFILGGRSASLVSVSIPGSFLAGILALGLAGVTLNIVVLFSLILTVGMLVDGVIVVTEYADRLMNLGVPRKQAYARASSAMAPSVITATLTTLLAFLPLLFWPGTTGEFMYYLPLTLIAVLSASLVMALFFVPTLGAYIGKPRTISSEALATLKAGDKGDFKNISPLAKKYVAVMKRCIQRPILVIVLSFVALVASVILYGAFGRGVIFFPQTDPDFAVIQMHARGNLSVFEKDTIMKEAEAHVYDIGGIDTIYTRTGKGGDSRDKAEDIIGSIYLEFADWQTRPLASVILAEAEKRLNTMPGVVVEVQRQKRGPPVGKDIQIKVGAREPERLYAAAQVIADKIKSTPYLTNIEEGVSIPGISWEMEIDRPKASQFAADVASIGSVVRLVTRGLKISDYRPNDSFEEVDIVARLPRHMRQLDEIDRLYVDTSMGQVPISTFVTRQARPKVGTIHRTDGIRTVTIKADVREGEGVLADDIVRATKSWLATQRPPPGVFVGFKGEDEKQNEAAAFLQKALLAALFLIALTLLTRFNRFYSVFLTLSAVIVSTVGVMLGLLLTYQPFSIIMNGIGIIALAGIVVNNNIILIDTWGRLKKTIKDPAEAVIRTGIQRIRPVLLTAVTTVLGLLPLVLGINVDFINMQITQGAPSTQFWQPLASSIAFGLTISTILTLVVTPSALMLADRITLPKNLLKR